MYKKIDCCCFANYFTAFFDILVAVVVFGSYCPLKRWPDGPFEVSFSFQPSLTKCSFVGFCVLILY